MMMVQKTFAGMTIAGAITILGCETEQPMGTYDPPERIVQDEPFDEDAVELQEEGIFATDPGPPLVAPGDSDAPREPLDE